MPDMNSEHKNPPRRVNGYTATFGDKALERDYFVHEYGRLGRYLRFFLSAGALLYFMFLVPDYLVFGAEPRFLFLFALRALFVFVSLVTLLALKKPANLPVMHRWITGYLALNCLNFIAVLTLYEKGNPYIQGFSVIMVILGIFLVPNRWVLSVTIAVAVIISYTALLVTSPGRLTGFEIAAIITYLVLALVLGAFSMLRGEYSKRLQYLTTRDLERMTVTDALTGVFNRKKFDDELSRWIMIAYRYHGPFSLVLIDIDNFKKINDTHGHRAGDAVLTGIAMLVSTQIREIDLFARWGGEEFALLLPQTGRVQAAVLADRIRAVIEKHQFPRIGRVTCSFGITEYLPEDTAESLFIRVDGLLYTAKSNGKNCVVSG
ncbi:MAG: GGDEF domain-containing protein [Spirochaetes bacterium]|nr:MAG: GGDEF domain-containing protein [Spirochaetota bacterium]